MGIFAIFQLFTGFISTAFKSFMSFITTYPKISITILVFIIGGLVGFKIKNSFDELKSQKNKLVEKIVYLEKQKIQLASDRDIVISANLKNQEVISKISVAFDKAKTQVNELEKKQYTSKIQIVNILDTIHKSLPEENGPIAPVLKNTINQIQNNRELSE